VPNASDNSKTWSAFSKELTANNDQLLSVISCTHCVIAYGRRYSPYACAHRTVRWIAKKAIVDAHTWELLPK